MGEKESVSDWGVYLSRHLQVLAVSFLEHFPPDQVAKLKHDHFYGGLSKRLKAMVAYLKPVLMRKHTLIIFMLHKRLRRKRQWNHPIAKLWLLQPQASPQQ